MIAGAGVPAALAAKPTTRPHVPAALLVVILPGQVIAGAVFTVRLATVEVIEPQELVMTTS